MNAVPLKPPVPYYGGKQSQSNEIWTRFGDTPNFIDPFMGACSILLGRPTEHLKRLRTETVNDKDGMIVNLFRAIKHDADSVAEWADQNVFESELHARHAWLVGQKESLTEKLEGDPDYYDAKIAGWFAWGMSCWIGSGFCSGDGPRHSVDGKLVNTNEKAVAGVYRKRPQLNSENNLIAVGNGVQRKRPHLLSNKGITRSRPQLHQANGINGISRQLLALKGRYTQRESLYEYFEALQERFRRVRVCAGNWTRVLGPSVTTSIGLTAVILDPPYSHDGRDTSLYNHDEYGIDVKVRDWAIAHGDDPLMRIAYCGYTDPSFQWPDTWTPYYWTANGGYGNQGNGQGRANKEKEVIYFNKSCLNPDAPKQMSLFGE